MEHALKTKPYYVSRSYSWFRKLCSVLERVSEINNPTVKGASARRQHDKGVITTEFPHPPLRCNFGLTLTEAHLSFRYGLIFSVYCYISIIYTYIGQGN